MKTKFLRMFLFFCLTTSLAVASVYAESLSEAEKSQKRDELDRFFSEAVIRTKPQEVKKVYQAFRVTANASTRLGYDSNVDLTTNNEDGDVFYEEKLAGRLDYAPEAARLFGHAAAMGLDARYAYLGYFDRDDSNRQSGLVAPFIRLELNPDLNLETAYEFRARIYDSLDNFTYLSHGVKGALNHQITPSLTQKVSLRYEALDYADRKALLPNATFTGGDREDDRYELVYGIRHRTGIWTFGVEGSWLWNDSNDQFFDYNDYEDAGIEATISARVTGRTVLTGFGGWHKRMYDERKILPALTTTQDDDWYYAGGRIFYAINPWSGVDVTATYYKNDSNDGNRDYDSVITSVGYHLYF